MRLIYRLLAALFLTFWVAFYVLNSTSYQRIVFFDKNATEGQFIRQLAEREATEKQVEIATHRFKASLNLVLTQFAKRHRVVILDQRNTLAGGEDVTRAIVNELSEFMRKKS
ncbi:TrbI F-type domain-containing protein [Legionella gresilensis]|uniref:TrbI F-type domain-containing protein n=1 Tax=Legionella gresilensis TaxID=91823 RepID=UPI001040F624|nr:TrbI F-type domain-containing protein [Legionella gresilensis]